MIYPSLVFCLEADVLLHLPRPAATWTRAGLQLHDLFMHTAIIAAAKQLRCPTADIFKDTYLYFERPIPSKQIFYYYEQCLTQNAEPPVLVLEYCREVILKRNHHAISI